MNAILITGETYPHRRDLRATGAIWAHDLKGYLAKADNERARQTALAAGLAIEPTEADPIDLEPATGERLRALRQARIDRRRERLLAQADNADKRADQAYNRIGGHERDFLKLAEPIKVGHHSEGRHRKLIQRYNDAMSKSCEESATAAKLRQRAEWMQPAQVKGDAERAKEAEREAARASIFVGDYIDTVVFGKGIVLKRNAKTFSVKIESSGRVLAAQQHWCKLIESRAPVPDAAHPGTTWKAGDVVELSPDHFGRVYVARVNRKTPKGYSVDKFWRMGDSIYATKLTVAAVAITGPGTLPDWADRATRND